MKAFNFQQFVLEDAGHLPPAVRLAKMGLSPGIQVLEWWAEVKAEDSAILEVFCIEWFEWPERTEDDFFIELTFDSRSSRGFIEKRLLEFARDSTDADWIYDMESDTWKRVNR